MGTDIRELILNALNFDTLSFSDSDGNWFVGIEDKDFKEVAERIEKAINKYLQNESNNNEDS